MKLLRWRPVPSKNVSERKIGHKLLKDTIKCYSTASAFGQSTTTARTRGPVVSAESASRPDQEAERKFGVVKRRQHLIQNEHQQQPDSRLIAINEGTFYDGNTSSSATSQRQPLVSQLSFTLHAIKPAYNDKPINASPHWAIISPNTTPVLEVLRGQHVASHPQTRKYPYLSSDYIKMENPALQLPSNAIQYVGFNNASGQNSSMRGAYLSARYESRREETDWTLEQYLRGQTELNASEELAHHVNPNTLEHVLQGLRIAHLRDMPVSNLSNGQTRRSRIAQALLQEPEVLLLDEPFMGLDPPSLAALSPVLQDMAYRGRPQFILGLRPQDPIPDWITHLAVFDGKNTMICMGRQTQVLYCLYHWSRLLEGFEHSDTRHKSFIERITERHGAPAMKFATILSRNGVRKFTAVEEVWNVFNPASMGFEEHFGGDDLSHQRDMARHTDRARFFSRSVSDPTIATFLRREWLQDPSPPVINTTSTSAENIAAERQIGQPLIELQSIIVKYGSSTVLGNGRPQPGYTKPGLNLTISRGSRMLIAGPNGSGKTTLLSLLTSDHPQSYSLPIKFFGRTRLPEPGKPGLSMWEIQSHIGYSSPEVHAFFPKNMSVRQVLESAWAETFQSKPALTPDRTAMIDLFLRVWKPELCQLSDSESDSLSWASDKNMHPLFGCLPFGTQRLLLFLRAIIKSPDIVILDEAFSGLYSQVRDKALNWLENGHVSVSEQEAGAASFQGLSKDQGLVVVSHDREEIPYSVDQYVRLPGSDEVEQGKTVVMQFCDAGAVRMEAGWNRLWKV